MYFSWGGWCFDRRTGVTISHAAGVNDRNPHRIRAVGEPFPQAHLALRFFRGYVFSFARPAQGGYVTETWV